MPPQDAEDLEIISARLQDAVAQVKDFVWLPKSRRFAALFNRFKWETAQKARAAIARALAAAFRRRAVGQVAHAQARRAGRGGVAAGDQLHAATAPTIRAASIELVLAGGGAIRLTSNASTPS